LPNLRIQHAGSTASQAVKLGGVAFVGASPALRTMCDMLARIARTQATVLIEGETGTGKELAARAIHYGGARRAGPFIPVNCGAIPESLVESEFFGHRRGAFTDAKDGSPGLLLLAHTGTLFLDEVDALSSRAQVALLRFLQDRTVRHVGEGNERTVDVRVIAACNTALEDLVARREFRQDLFYRLKVLHIDLPPLRERDADALLLADHFLAALCDRYGRPPLTLDDQSKLWLLRQPWPGNVRHLENLLERNFLLSEGQSLLRLSTAPDCDDSSANGLAGPDAWNYRSAKACAMETFDRSFLETLLRFAQGNVSLAARLAGKERRDLGRLLRKYAIAPQAFRSEG
jgi:two-component system, NtrC family, response regulator GlrR